MKKRITAIIIMLCLALMMVFTGCGEDKTPAQPDAAVTAVSSADKQPEVLPEDASVESASASAETEPENGTAGTEEVSSVSSSSASETVSQTEPEEEGLTVTEDGEYTDKDHVALYIHEFGHLPSNYVTKNKAADAGWDSRAGNLNTVLPGKSIGGSRFGNYEGLLPEKNGRKYYECDIDFNPDGQTTEPAYRNEKRIIYSNDGLIFYTEDHYQTFEQLY